jgi:hypothetical protein
MVHGFPARISFFFEDFASRDRLDPELDAAVSTRDTKVEPMQERSTRLIRQTKGLFKP